MRGKEVKKVGEGWEEEVEERVAEGVGEEDAEGVTEEVLETCKRRVRLCSTVKQRDRKEEF